MSVCAFEPGVLIQNRLKDGLIGYWKLEDLYSSGVWEDSTKFGNSLTSSDTNKVFLNIGKVNSAAGIIDPSTIDAASTNVVRNANNSDMSVAFWFNTLVNSSGYHIVGKWGDGTVATREWVFYFESNRIGLYTTGSSVTANSFGNLSTNVWYFVYGSHHDGTNYISINNGTVDSAASTAITGSNAILRIGNRSGSVASYWTGIIDELGIWNRALTASEVTQLYQTATWPHMLTVQQSGQGSVYPVSTSPRPQVLYNPDFDSDSDDIVDALLLLNLEHQGKLDIVASVITSTNMWAAPAFYSVASYYGRTNLTVGVDTNSVGNSQSWFDYDMAQVYADSAHTNASQFDDYLKVQRQTLAAAADNSIVYLTTGDLNSVRGLLQSTPDGYSGLSGVALVAQKVSCFMCVAGNWPTGPKVSDFGQSTGRSLCSAYVLSNWPSSVPIVFVPINQGTSVMTGANVMENLSTNNPARYGWNLWSQGTFGNTSSTNPNSGWSQIGIMPLAFGFAPYSTTSTNYAFLAGVRGAASIDTSGTASDGSTYWAKFPNANHSYMWKGLDDGPFATAINNLIIDKAAW